MTRICVLLQQINQIDFSKLKPLCDSIVKVLPDTEADNDEIIVFLDDNIQNSEFLELILGVLYKDLRQSLTAEQRPQMPINILFNARPSSYDTFDFIFSSSDIVQLKGSNTYHALNVPFHVQEIPNKSISKDYNKYEISALGGTFDHIHDGHKILLSIAAFLTSERLIIGVTDQELLKNKKFKEYLDPYALRCNHVTDFLKLVKPSLRPEIYVLRDVCGPTLKVEEIQCLCLTKETLKGGKVVNDSRKKIGMHELEVYIIDILGGSESDNWEGKLSSTGIREQLMLKDKHSTI